MSDLVQRFQGIVNEVVQRLNDVDEDLKILADKIEKSLQPKVKLNVGGMKFVTTIQTLKSHKRSFFDVMLSGKWNVEETIFIDRDGSVFKYVLDFLRGELDISMLSPFDLQRLQKEADFYQVSTAVAGRAAVLGTEEYREGVIIFKLSILSVGTWLFIGIGNGNDLNNGQSYSHPRAYGWAGSNQVYAGGANVSGRDGYSTDMTSGDTVTLLLDCNNNFLLFKNDTKKSKPFILILPPGGFWRLHLNLFNEGSRVKLVDKKVFM